MSNLSDPGGGERFSDRNKLAKRLEKSNFAQTCSLLSKFLKEKRNFSDLSPEKIETPRKKARDEVEKPKVTATTMINSRTSMVNSVDNLKDNLPKFTGFSPSGISDNAANKGEFRRPATPEHVTAQMTIFYAGKVMVYDEFPNEIAKEIMAMANKGSRSSNNPDTVEVAPNRSSSAAHHTFVEKPSGSSIAGEPDVVSKTQPAVLMKPTPEQQLKPQPEAKNSSEMPIARRASLHRFLTKRKDRSVAIAPYQVNLQPETSYKASETSEPAPEPEEDFPRRQLDLNF